MLCDSRFRGALTAFDPVTSTGWLKRCVIMESNVSSSQEQSSAANHEAESGIKQPSNEGGMLRVNWITNGIGSQKQRKALEAMSQHTYSKAHVPISGIVQSVHTQASIRSPVDSVHVLCGSSKVVARVLHVEYCLAPNSFFQVNWDQAVMLFSEVVKAADMQPRDTVLDLYCGTGALSLQFSKSCAHVVGVDIVPASIEDARANAQLNGCTNVSFYTADLRAKRSADRRTFELQVVAAQADLIIADPGRSGLSEAVKQFIIDDGAARRFLYVSCNSESMCRDIRDICTRGQWTCTRVTGLDMFPQTDHLEQIAVLERSATLGQSTV